MADTEAAMALRMRVQVAWEQSMDIFYEKLDRLSAGSTEIDDADVIKAVSTQIDDDTADEYQRWIDG